MTFDVWDACEARHLIKWILAPQHLPTTFLPSKHLLLKTLEGNPIETNKNIYRLYQVTFPTGLNPWTFGPKSKIHILYQIIF